MTDVGRDAAGKDVACDCVSNMVAPIRHLCFLDDGRNRCAGSDLVGFSWLTRLVREVGWLRSYSLGTGFKKPMTVLSRLAVQSYCQRRSA